DLPDGLSILAKVQSLGTRCILDIGQNNLVRAVAGAGCDAERCAERNGGCSRDGDTGLVESNHGGELPSVCLDRNPSSLSNRVTAVSSRVGNVPVTGSPQGDEGGCSMVEGTKIVERRCLLTEAARRSGGDQPVFRRLRGGDPAISAMSSDRL